MPVAIIFGGRDINLAADVARDFADRIPGSTVQIVEDAGHFVQIDRPDVIAAELLS